MRELMERRLGAMFLRWQDLVERLPETALSAELPVASNSVGAQLWCVVGARESYTRALAAGEWQGFSCSLGKDEEKSRSAVLAALQASATEMLALLARVDLTSEREMLLLDLLEHEAQHQGQLIRYVYGLGYSFPESWRQRWALG